MATDLGSAQSTYYSVTDAGLIHLTGGSQVRNWEIRAFGADVFLEQGDLTMVGGDVDVPAVSTDPFRDVVANGEVKEFRSSTAAIGLRTMVGQTATVYITFRG